MYNYNDNNNNITLKRTRNLSNDACFNHDNNVCACAVSASILLPVVNLSVEINSATSISYIRRGQFCHSTLLFVYFGDFTLRMRSLDRITTSGLKCDVIFEFNASVSL